jgi:predicted RNase H-like nuclease (RuvC/YqgF family)
MSDEMTEQLAATAGRLASAAETLDRVLEKLDAQQESLNAKVDRIVAAVEDGLTEDITEGTEGSTRKGRKLQEQVAELRKSNEELKAQAARMARKTLSPMVTALLSKHGDGSESLEAGALDKILLPLSIEQRIAVKAEMARAGMIE